MRLNLLALFCLLLIGACAATAQTAQPTESEAIRIDGGDLVEIRVFGVPELTQEARVDGNGEVTVGLIGGFHIAGLSTSEAQSALERAFKDNGVLNNPRVTVFVKEYATQGISVLGEVAKPGIYPLLGTRRLFDVISVAGGTTARAGKMVTITRRDQPDKPVTVEMTDNTMANAQANVIVRPGDTVVVSRAGVVYVVGDVGRPSGVTMDSNERLTVLQALAVAGGANRTAALGRAKVIRREPNGTLKEIPMPLDKVLAAKADDMELAADDILFVPNSTVKSAARRGLEAIVQTATGVAIYRR